MNESAKSAIDSMETIMLLLICDRKMEIIVAVKDSTVVVTIDTNVSLTTCFFFGLSFVLRSIMTAAKPNNIEKTRENTVVSTSANSASIWYGIPNTISTDTAIGITKKQIKSQIENLLNLSFLNILNWLANKRIILTFLLKNSITKIRMPIIKRIQHCLFIYHNSDPIIS